MMNPLARLYNFHGKLSRRDFLVYWLWVFLLPKVWPFLAVFFYYLIFGIDIKVEELAVGGFLSFALHLLLMSFFLGAIWRRMNDIGFSVWPKLLICALAFVIPPYGWILQLIMVLLPCRRKH
jgi:uncharacterized membrane protein YhaH (DUF805 family)